MAASTIIILTYLLLALFVGSAQAQDGECSCSPRTFTFQLDFSASCPQPPPPFPPNPNDVFGAGVATYSCDIDSLDSSSATPVIMLSIRFQEFDTEGNLINQSPYNDVELTDGATFTYESISSSDPTAVPGGMALDLRGRTANSPVLNVLSIVYTNDCGVPTFRVGDSIGWVIFVSNIFYSSLYHVLFILLVHIIYSQRFSHNIISSQADFEPASEETCAAPAPTLTPSTAPTAVGTPAPTPKPTVVPAPTTLKPSSSSLSLSSSLSFSTKFAANQTKAGKTKSSKQTKRT